MPPPSPIVLDVWSQESDTKTVVLDVLLPNGIFLNLKVNRISTLLETKEDVWEVAQHRPLYGLLHDPDSYVFICINSSTAEREEQIDETRRLCDVRPFQGVLRLVERKGDPAEKTLNSQIRFLLGKGLNEFDVQKDPEINLFRKKMRLFSEEICQQERSQSWQEKLLNQYPIQVEPDMNLPEYLSSKLHDGNLVLSISMHHCSSESTTTFKLSVNPNVNAAELLEIIGNRKAHSLGVVKKHLENFLLKICGLEEYLIGPSPLVQYKYIQGCLSCGKIPELSLMHMDTVQFEDFDESLMKLVEKQRSRSFHDTSSLPRRRKQISSWTIKVPFHVRINSIHRLNCENKTKVAVQIGVFHGMEAVTALYCTREGCIEEGECLWEEDIEFQDLRVCNIPRMARLCVCVYEVTRAIKNNRTRKCPENKEDLYANPIAWVNTTIYDFRNVLKSGPITLHMWPYAQDVDNDVMLNPLGGNFCNPNKDQTSVLTVSFEKYHKSSPLVFPSLNEILKIAADESNDNNPNLGSGAPQASKSHLEQLRQICEKDSLYQLHEQEKELMWFLRNDCCLHLPESLPKLLRCVKWEEQKDAAQMTSLLQVWPKISPLKALELLDYAYADQTARSFAVTCIKEISEEELSLYLLQLVQALKHEPYLQCDLVEFLLKRSLSNRHIGHQLFWLLRSEMQFPNVSIRFGLILEAYCRGAMGHIKCLTRQMEALNKLKIANELVQIEGNKKKDSREKLRSMIQEILGEKGYQNIFINMKNPLDPRLKFGKLRVEKCKFLDSKMKPLWLAFENADIYGDDVFIIFKNGNDLRQDMLTLQMIRIVDKMWKNEGLDLRMIPYHCLATDHMVGLIEVVPNSDTIANIQKEKGFTATSAFKKGSILAWLRDHNPNEKSLFKATEEFTLSCAGYCVFTYIFGVADRHSDNIMVKTNGQLFHIDFGHILGKFKEKFGIKRERVPFVLTHDFVYIITKGQNQKSEEFNRFQQCCEQAFSILRRKGPLLISLFAMMLSTGIPELTCEKDLDYLRETLVLDMTEQEALRHFRSKFDDALRNSWKTSVNWMAHNWSKDNRMTD